MDLQPAADPYNVVCKVSKRVSMQRKSRPEMVSSWVSGCVKSAYCMHNAWMSAYADAKRFHCFQQLTAFLDLFLLYKIIFFNPGFLTF